MFGIDDALLGSVASSVLSGLFSDNASSQASDAYKSALDFAKQMNERTYNDLGPYRQAGNVGLNMMYDLMGVDPNGRYSTPQSGGQSSQGTMPSYNQVTGAQYQPGSAGYQSLFNKGYNQDLGGAWYSNRNAESGRIDQPTYSDMLEAYMQNNGSDQNQTQQPSNNVGYVPQKPSNYGVGRNPMMAFNNLSPVGTAGRVPNSQIDQDASRYGWNPQQVADAKQKYGY